jgi:glycosyltransferase involved in cell wall biosynthesis
LDTNKNIFINGRFLSQETTGVQKFATEIARELVQSDLNVRVIAPNDIVQEENAALLNAETIGSLKGHLWEQLELAHFAKKHNGYLVNLANMAPLNFSPQLVTLHDAAFKVNPDWFSKKFAVGYNMLIPRLLKDADRVFTVSKSAAQDIQKYFKVPDDKLAVAHNGICGSFIDIEIPKQADRKPFILAVSSLNPRKNFRNLIHAFKELHRDDIQLVLTGAGHKAFADSDVMRLIEGDDRIIFKGYVDEKELIELYATASLFVYPSLYEGFGLPILEAMHFGCPVAASDSPVFNELFGGSFQPFDPEDVYSISAALRQLLENDKQRNELSTRGHETSQQYRYSNSARVYIDFLKKRLENTTS